jgi:hypothetical protein
MDTSLKARPVPWRRPVLIFVWIVVPIALICAAVFYAYFSHYQPLGEPYFFGTKHADLIPVRVDGQNLSSHFETVLVRYEKDGWFVVNGIIENDGRFPITVTRVFRGPQGGTFGLREVRFGASLEEERFSRAWKQYPEFEPFRLAPGENRLFAAFFDFKDSACRYPGGTGGGIFGVDSFQIEYEASGIASRTSVPYMYEVSAVNPTRSECARDRS